MGLFATSLIAGFLTILAPCVLPLLPVILGGAVAESQNRRRPFIIVASLSVSVFVFTLLLKGSTALLNVSPTVWSYISAVILGVYGLSLVFPYAWARIMLRTPGHGASERALSNRSSVVVGLALGPVFTTCSPTYFLILATVLPQSLGAGLLDLIAYIIGLAVALLLVAWIGQKLVNKLEWATDPNGWFRKTLGVLFILVAVAIASGYDKKIQTSILEAGFFDVTKLEQTIHEALDTKQDMPFSGALGAPGTAGAIMPQQTSLTLPPDLDEKIEGEVNGGRYVEIVRPAGFINTSPLKLADLIGKKVVMIDFIDYSCINCQRTFPYMREWYKKYKDMGLEIVAIHTPEFAFEKDIKNVAAAAKEFGLAFPIVLDNDYATWNAYRNQYWPHKYIIDIHGNIVYHHIGEGAYENTEKEIVKQLNIRKRVLGEEGSVARAGASMPAYAVQSASPETYFGAYRNEYFGNGTPEYLGDRTYETPAVLESNRFYLGGKWSVDKEYIESLSASTTLSYVFAATNVNLVAGTKDGAPVEAEIRIDGVLVQTITISSSKLYTIYKAASPGQHRLDILFKKPGVRTYTFTFG